METVPSESAEESVLKATLRPQFLGQEHSSKAGKALATQRRVHWPLFERTASGTYRRRGRWQLHMFISQPPCGDACIFANQAPFGTDSEHLKATRWRRTGAKRLKAAQEQAADVGQVGEPVGSGDQRRSKDVEQSSNAQNTAESASAPNAQEGAGRTTMDLQREGERQQEGVLRRKPGRGEPTMSLSCRYALKCRG